MTAELFMSRSKVDPEAQSAYILGDTFDEVQNLIEAFADHYDMVTFTLPTQVGGKSWVAKGMLKHANRSGATVIPEDDGRTAQGGLGEKSTQA